MAKKKFSDYKKPVRKLTAKELRVLFPKLVESLRSCAEWMDELRISGDAGDWEWEPGDEFTNARDLLTEVDNLEKSSLI